MGPKTFLKLASMWEDEVVSDIQEIIKVAVRGGDLSYYTDINDLQEAATFMETLDDEGIEIQAAFDSVCSRIENLEQEAGEDKERDPE